METEGEIGSEVVEVKQETKPKTAYVVLTCAVLVFLSGAIYSLFVKANSVPTEIVEDTNALGWTKSTQPPWGARDSQTGYVFGDSLFVFGGLDANDTKVNPTTPVYEKAIYYNDIWRTSDGENWELVTEHSALPPMRSLSIVEFGGALYALGGWSSDPKIGYDIGIWKSDDGISWMQIEKQNSLPFAPREGFRTVEQNGKICFFGGVNYFRRKTYNDTWCSADAKNWEKMSESAGWHTRWDYDAVSYRGVLYLMGGMDFGDAGWHDVWRSDDSGVTWTKILDEAPWSERQGHVTLVWKDLIWLVGGLHPAKNTGVGDTWYSGDGVTWIKTEGADFARGREDHSVLLWRDSLWLLGGMTDDWKWVSEVWTTAKNLDTINKK